MIAIVAPVIALEHILELQDDTLIAYHLHPGGQGVHLARVLQRFGEDCALTAFNGGETAPVMRALLDAHGIRHHLVDIPHATATVVTVERDGACHTAWQLPPPPVPRHEADSLVTVAASLVLESKAAIFTGSLPAGMPATFLARLVRAANRHGIPTVVDLAPECMDLPLAAGPTIIKPNLDQLRAMVPLGPAPTEEDILDAAAELRARGAHVVVVTLGAQGALALGPEGAWRLWPPEMEVGNEAGMGDCMVAIMALGLARGWPLEYTLRVGAAAGAAQAMRHDLGVCQPEVTWRLLRRVRLEALAA